MGAQAASQPGCLLSEVRHIPINALQSRFDAISLAGQSITCIQSRDPPTFTVTSNITGDANTCDPWGLTIVGGVKPYNVTLAALSSPVITNVTMGGLDDRFTYINRADPNTILLGMPSFINL